MMMISFSLITTGPLNAAEKVATQKTKAKSIPQDINLDAWDDIKDDLYDKRAINEKAAWLTLDAPYRAYDAGLVPITIKATPQKPGQYFKGLTLIIDNNPVPVAAVFNMSPKMGVLNIETRIRIDQYSHVRAIIETNDGELFMAAKYVKAAGGCSAPAMKDMDAKMAMLGKSKMRQFTPAQKQASKQSKSTREIQLMVRHPNYSGMQLNQETGYYIPAHYVEEMIVQVDGEQLMKIEGAISLSEDPIIRFQFQSNAKQPVVNFQVRDTKQQVFKKQWELKALASQGS